MAGVVVRFELGGVSEGSREVEGNDNVTFGTPGTRGMFVEFPSCLDPSFKRHRLCK